MILNRALKWIMSAEMNNDDLRDPDYEPEQGAELDHEDLGDPDNEPEQGAGNVPSKHKKSLSEWKKDTAKRLRMKGKAYKGMKRVDGKWDYHVNRSGRILAPKNCLKRCDRYGVKQCQNISDNDRKVIFNRFWNMNWDQTFFM